MNKQPLVKIGEGLLVENGEIVRLTVKEHWDAVYAMTNPQKFELDVPAETRHVWVSAVTEFPDKMKIMDCFVQDGKLHLSVANWSYSFDISVTFFGLDFCGCKDVNPKSIVVHKTEGISSFPILIDKFEGNVPTGKDLSISYKSQNGFDMVMIQPHAKTVESADIKVTKLDTYNITLSGSNNELPFKLTMKFYVL